jgi:lipopolysaccharide/colanic/teichoic acid biosynthesis glycosyltransferase
MGLLVGGDIIAFIGALFLTLTIRYGELPREEIFLEHLGPFAVLSVLWALIFFISGLYDTQVALFRKRLPDLILKVQAINTLLAALFFFLFPVGITPKTTLALYLIVSTVLIASWRLFLFPRLSSSNPVRAVVIGEGKETEDLVRVLNDNPHFDFISAEVIDPRNYLTTEMLHGRLIELIGDKGVDILIGDMRPQYIEQLAPLYYKLTFLHSDIRFMSVHALYEQVFHRVPPSLIGETWFLENVTTQAPHYAYDFLKRSMDIVGASLLLVPCLILFPLVALAIKIHDRGPILYRAQRLGQYNRPISILKFRTMNGMDSGMTLDTKLVVTPLGRVLRALRIDELPQLWNVFRGDLSFIGPRPEFPARAQVYAEKIPYYNMRHLIKPGLSGWAQINNFEVPRGEVDVERTVAKLSYDLFYLKRRSVLLDIEIVLKTIKTLALRSGT